MSESNDYYVIPKKELEKIRQEIESTKQPVHRIMSRERFNDLIKLLETLDQSTPNAPLPEPQERV